MSGRLLQPNWRRTAKNCAENLHTANMMFADQLKANRAIAEVHCQVHGRLFFALRDLLDIFDRKDLQSWSVPEVLRLEEIRQIARKGK
jgi:hypothetical protein